MNITFTKAHGAGNDFLLTWQDRSTNEAAFQIAVERVWKAMRCRRQI